jgi:hypothetical protein
MNDIAYKLDGATISITKQDGSISNCTLPWPIVQVLEFPGILVLRIEPPPRARFNENVYGIRPDATVAWQVSKREYVYDDSPYTGMIQDEGNVKLMNWDGLELLVNPRTGEELLQQYGR